jgi:surfeit locus 1 family protein
VTRAENVRRYFTPGLIGLHLFAVAAIAFCIIMGMWQSGTYDSRQEHERADKQSVPRVAMSEIWGPDEPFVSRLNHRPVTVEGEFAPAAEQVWVTGKEHDGRDGAWLLAPFLVDGGDDALLLARGWAPKTGPLPEVPAGPVSIEAVLEPGESNAGSFDAADRTIGSVRLPTLINELPYDLYSGFAINEDPAVAGGLELISPPEGGDVPWTEGLRNLAYAFQWWVFALFAAFMWWRMTTETVSARRSQVP